MRLDSSKRRTVAERPIGLITGASSGIGYEFAIALARRGYDTVLVARRRDRLEELASAIVAADPHARAEIIVADLTSRDAADSIAASVANLGLDVDLLVNNAGFGTHGRFAENDTERENELISVNVAALVALTHAFLPGMLKRGHGGVINLSSTAAFQPTPFMAVYGASKAFVLAFSQALHEEVRSRGVRVLALCPGSTPTEFASVAGDGTPLGPQLGQKRTARGVVETGLRAFDNNESVVIDGFNNAVMANATRLFPPSIATRLAGRMLRPRL
jgi:short-subunit dehydrogenase